MNVRLLGTLAGAVLLTACTGGAPAPAAAPAPQPPAPPAACLLDTEALRLSTGLTWTADPTTATDTRCVYDPSGGVPSGGDEFVVVDVAPDPATPLDEVAALCADGTRTPAGAGFGCRLAGGGVFAATVRDGELVTLAAAAVPAATTADRLATALTEQLTRIG